MRYKCFLGIFFICVQSSSFLQTTEAQQEYISVFVPGQNGAGGDSYDDFRIINTKKTINCLTPNSYFKIDMGQGHCVKHFENALAEKDSLIQNKKMLLFGVSQGTATLTRWLGSQTHEEQEKKVSAVFLESFLGSGHSAIMRTVESGAKPFSYLPFIRFWLPWLSKVLFPTYNPVAKTPLAFAKNVSPKIPVIIMHNVHDFQLSINDARQLYCTLRENSNNVYYFELEHDNSAIHYDILCMYDNRNAKAIEIRNNKIFALQAIYQKYNLPFNPKAFREGIDLSEYQPSIDEVKNRIKLSTAKPYFYRNAIDLLSASLFGAWYFMKHIAH